MGKQDVRRPVRRGPQHRFNDLPDEPPKRPHGDMDGQSRAGAVFARMFAEAKRR